jgi:ribosomal protein S18 acetylase RimI-like enzyme
MTYRRASVSDCKLLAELNRQLIQDEGHRNPMSVPQLEERMRHWLMTREYEALIFEEDSKVTAYALYKEETDRIYLRHLFVVHNQRRRGIGRKAMQILLSELWPQDKRVTVEVLIHNQPAISFYRALGYKDYSVAMEIPSAE